MKFPNHRKFPILKFHALVAEKPGNLIFISGQITERGGILQREFQRLAGVVETDEPKLAGNFARRAQCGDGIRRRAEADIPDDKFAGIIFQPFADFELPDVKQFGFRLRAEAGVHFLAVCG